jgi:hypothetical protein
MHGGAHDDGDADTAASNEIVITVSRAWPQKKERLTRRRAPFDVCAERHSSALDLVRARLTSRALACTHEQARTTTYRGHVAAIVTRQMSVVFDA